MENIVDEFDKIKKAAEADRLKTPKKRAELMEEKEKSNSYINLIPEGWGLADKAIDIDAIKLIDDYLDSGCDGCGKIPCDTAEKVRDSLHDFKGEKAKTIDIPEQWVLLTNKPNIHTDSLGFNETEKKAVASFKILCKDWQPYDQTKGEA
ncbi:MAG: hypothetical protein NTW06_01440 [Candidatus Falkowbacteria bacterium]|nr:hypothetical protein [Candidatus Falkowbacteria bacterium]